MSDIITIFYILLIFAFRELNLNNDKYWYIDKLSDLHQNTRSRSVI